MPVDFDLKSSKESNDTELETERKNIEIFRKQMTILSEAKLTETPLKENIETSMLFDTARTKREFKLAVIKEANEQIVSELTSCKVSELSSPSN